MRLVLFLIGWGVFSAALHVLFHEPLLASLGLGLIMAIVLALLATMLSGLLLIARDTVRAVVCPARNSFGHEIGVNRSV